MVLEIIIGKWFSWLGTNLLYVIAQHTGLTTISYIPNYMETTKMECWPIVLCLLLASEWCVVSGADCTFSVPSTTEPDSCTQYDLTTLSAKGPFTLSDTKYNYTFGLCKEFTPPKQCSSNKAGMMAFQYNNNSCYGIGSSEADSMFVVSCEEKLEAGV